MILESNERQLRKTVLNGVTRLEKLLFLLQNETSFEGVADFYKFKAYNFGPFSKEVYESVDFLEGCGFIGVQEKTYSTSYSNAAESELM